MDSNPSSSSMGDDLSSIIPCKRIKLEDSTTVDTTTVTNNAVLEVDDPTQQPQELKPITMERKTTVINAAVLEVPEPTQPPQELKPRMERNYTYGYAHYINKSPFDLGYPYGIGMDLSDIQKKIISDLGGKLCDIVIRHNNDANLFEEFIGEISKYDQFIRTLVLWGSKKSSKISYRFGDGKYITNNCIFEFLIKYSDYSPTSVVKYLYEEIKLVNCKNPPTCMVALQFMYGYDSMVPTNELTYYLIDELFNFGSYLNKLSGTKLIYDIILFAIKSNYLNSNNENILHIICKNVSHNQLLVSYEFIDLVYKCVYDNFKWEKLRKILSKLVNSADKNGNRPFDILLSCGEYNIIRNYIDNYISYMKNITDKGIYALWLRYSPIWFFNQLYNFVKHAPDSKILKFISAEIPQLRNMSLYDLLRDPHFGRKAITNMLSYNILALKAKELINIIESYMFNCNRICLNSNVQINDILAYYYMYAFCLDVLEKQTLLECLVTPEISLQIMLYTPEFSNFIKLVSFVLPDIVGDAKINMHTLIDRILNALNDKNDFEFRCKNCHFLTHFKINTVIYSGDDTVANTVVTVPEKCSVSNYDYYYD